MSARTVSAGRFARPTLDTRFFIDFRWWERSQEDLQIYLLSHVQPAQRKRLAERAEKSVIDYIDPETAEVFQVDELWFAIRQAAQEPDFINPQTSLVDSVFRVFLANGNQPRTPRQLAGLTGRNASIILKTFGSTRIYRGIRPWQPDHDDTDRQPAR